jgi:hypothetical protein
VHGVDLLHFIAGLTLALLVIRGGQAIVEHYFPDSGFVPVERFVYGGPS